LNNHFVILAHVPTNSVTRGFIPQLRHQGIPLVVVTDQPERHQLLVNSGVLSANEIIAIDVFNPIAVLNILTQHLIKPAAVFTNSDHLQASAAIIANYYGLPGKNWQSCYRTKNKLAMRQAIKEAGLDTLWFQPIISPDDLTNSDIPFPCIAKPIEGVASENVTLVQNKKELKQTCHDFWKHNPGQPLLLEEYFPGPLHTLETIGDGQQLQIMGSFETFLSSPPYFIELGQAFSRQLPADLQHKILDQLEVLGVGFSTCHTEFVLTDQGPKLIEVNYRNIGDQSDFLMAQALQFDIFAAVIDLYLGKPMLSVPESSHSAEIICQIAQQSGVIQSVPNNCSIERNGCIVDFEALCQADQHHQQDNSNRDYLSILRGTGPCEKTLNQTMAELAKEYLIHFKPDGSITEKVA
jgi:biotin carboxylase